jgi:thermostable 8-oxoguanine DNA glycosylase
MLGGFGMPAEVGLAAFERLQSRSLIRHDITESEIYLALKEPLSLSGRQIRYRYPKQKARFIAAALHRLGSESAPTDDIQFRDWLLSFTGIGPKTASWITRNWLSSDRVAILDVHLHRAGLLMGLFSPGDSLTRDYSEMEEKLVSFASALGVRLSDLDDLIWRYMKELNQLALGLIETKSLGAAGR